MGSLIPTHLSTLAGLKVLPYKFYSKLFGRLLEEFAKNTTEDHTEQTPQPKAHQFPTEAAVIEASAGSAGSIDVGAALQQGETSASVETQTQELAASTHGMMKALGPDGQEEETRQALLAGNVGNVTEDGADGRSFE